MKLPGRLNEFEADVQRKLRELPGANCDYHQVTQWICQFDPQDQEIAIRLFLAINFFSLRDIQGRCLDLLRKVAANLPLDQVRFCPLGKAGDSGGRIIHDFRVAANLDSDLCVEKHDLDAISGTEVKALVFLDDFIGSGGEVLDEWSNQLKPRLHRFHGDIYYIPLVGFSPAIADVEKQAGFQIMTAYSLDECDQVFHKSSQVLGLTKENKSSAKARFEMIGERLFPGHPLGWRDGQFALVFYYGPPNNSLPVLWSSAGGWVPLFPRRGQPHTTRLSAAIKDVAVPVGDSFGIVDVQQEPRRELREHQDSATRRPESRSIAIDQLSDKHLKLLYALASVGGTVDEYNLQEIARFHEQEFRALLSSLLKTEIIQRANPEYVDQIKLALPRTEIDALVGEKPEIRSAVGRQLTSVTLKQLEGLSGDRLSLLQFLMENDAIVTNACRWARENAEESFLQLRRYLSVLYLKQNRLQERLQLGKDALALARSLKMQEDEFWILIDDIGWSLGASNQYEPGRKAIRLALGEYSPDFGPRAFSKAWRHLAAIDILEKRFDRAFVLLVFCFALARHTPIQREQALAEIERGFGILAIKAGNAPRAIPFFKSAQTRYLEQDDSYGLLNIRRHIDGVKKSGEGIVLSDFRPFQILLVRHTQTLKNRDELFGRSKGDELTAHGEQIAQRFAARFVETFGQVPGNTLILSSPSRSCEALRNSLSNALSCEAEVVGELQSIDTGELTGLSEKEASERFVEAYNGLQEFREHKRDGADILFPGGDTVFGFEQRVIGAVLERTYLTWPLRRLIILGHRSIITALLNATKALSRSARGFLYRYEEIELAGVYECRFDFADWAVDFRERILFVDSLDAGS